MLSKPVCRHRTSACSALRRRISQSVDFNTFSSFAFPIVASLASISTPCRSALDVSTHREIQTQIYRSHIAMSRQLSFAWKASLTRTPPPICTSALGSHTALVRRALSVANELQIHQARFLAIRDSPRFRESPSVLQCCNCGTPHQVFESAHRILERQVT